MACSNARATASLAQVYVIQISHMSVQGYIPGVSFAHSLVSHSKMQSVDDYLTRIDGLPAALKACKVT